MKKIFFMLCAIAPMMAFAANSPSYDVDASSHHHHHHRSGPTGPTGPIGPTGPTGPTGSSFTTPVVGDTLTATVAVPTGAFSGATGSFIRPYVSTPNGMVLEGPTTLLSGVNGTTLTFPTVTPVVAGTYIYGLLINGAGVSLGANTLPVVISSTAEGVSTSAHIFVPAGSISTADVQLNVPYVYNAPSFP